MFRHVTQRIIRIPNRTQSWTNIVHHRPSTCISTSTSTSRQWIRPFSATTQTSTPASTSTPTETPTQTSTPADTYHNKYHLVTEGEGLTWKLYYQVADYAPGYMSPWHDIPLRNKNGMVTYVNEIPKGTRAKMEISTKERFNPIHQDVKKGKLRFFTFGDIPFNYGCLPQTWEDPHQIHPDTGCKGDNDPLDIVELSGTPLPTGHVIPVRILGALAMIDEGETDWKLLAISKHSPLFDKLLNLEDIDIHCPGLLDTIRHWFKMYKTTDGKPENTFGFDGKFQSRDYAHQIVNQCNLHWKQLLNGRIEPDSLWLPENPYQTTPYQKPTAPTSTSTSTKTPDKTST